MIFFFIFYHNFEDTVTNFHKDMLRDCSFEIREGGGGRFGGRVIKFLTSLLGVLKFMTPILGGYKFS